MCATDLTCVNATIWLVLRDCFLGLTYGFLNKNFQEIKLFICHCSFITLAQKTTMSLQIVRFLETFRRVLSWIKTEVLFLYMFRIELLFIFSFVTWHSRISAVLQCVMCYSFSITCALNTGEYRLNKVYCVCFQSFVWGFIFSLKKWAYLNNDRRPVSSVGRAPDCCAGGLGFEPQTATTVRVLK